MMLVRKRTISIVQTERWCKVKKYTVNLEMENGSALVFETNEADDEQHAQGLAIAWAVEKTGEQVYDVFCVISDGGWC